jgi:hypothetical protein
VTRRRVARLAHELQLQRRVQPPQKLARQLDRVCINRGLIGRVDGRGRGKPSLEKRRANAASIMQRYTPPEIKPGLSRLCNASRRRRSGQPARPLRRRPRARVHDGKGPPGPALQTRNAHVAELCRSGPDQSGRITAACGARGRGHRSGKPGEAQDEAQWHGTKGATRRASLGRQPATRPTLTLLTAVTSRGTRDMATIPTPSCPSDPLPYTSRLPSGCPCVWGASTNLPAPVLDGRLGGARHIYMAANTEHTRASPRKTPCDDAAAAHLPCSRALHP